MKPIDFGLFYFASSEGGAEARDGYRLILESARYADRHGFSSVWTPERHFHAFGGLSPNPSVLAAALAAVTERIEIRPGSVVVPLHDPVRVVEEWSMVDNLSNGRVGLGVASGWFPNDFILAPDLYQERKDVLFGRLETIRALWRGESLRVRNGVGDMVEVHTLPRPVRPELPVWITSAMNPDTFEMAGRIGANVLTHLLWQSVEQLAPKIERFRQAWREAGHPGEGTVTVMVHTFVAEDATDIRELVRNPMKGYLGSSVSLAKNYLFSLSPFRGAPETSVDGLSAEQVDAALEYSFERYFQTSGLFGTPESCLHTLDRMQAAGVDEVGCLIDFGVEVDRVLDSLEALNRLRQLHRAGTRAALPVAQPSAADMKPEAQALEEVLADLWSELLEQDCVDTTTNLFDLGVHSLLAVRAVAEIRERTGHTVAITDLFRFPNIRSLAMHVSGERDSGLDGARARAELRQQRRRRVK